MVSRKPVRLPLSPMLCFGLASSNITGNYIFPVDAAFPTGRAALWELEPLFT